MSQAPLLVEHDGPFDLTGRVALVTGATRGLGRAIATGLARAGAHVVIAGRTQSACAAVAAEIAAAGGQASAQAFELGDHAAVAAAIPALVARLGRLDILVNNAGISHWSAFEDITQDQFEAVIAVNLTAPFLLCREAARAMRVNGWGRIVNVTSFVATTGRERLAAYSASKSGVEGLTRSIAAEYAPHGITCNAVAPSFFDTDMARPTVSDPERSAAYRRAIAMGRFGAPDEMIGPVLFLASPASSYVTGHVLPVDGGVDALLTIPVTVPATIPDD